MREPKQAHRAEASRLVELEGKSTNDVALAAERVFEKTFGLLSPILGQDGTSALFARSTQLAAARFPSLGDPDLDAGRATSPAQAVAARLRRSPATSREAAVAVYATLLSLLETLIGERLTSQLLRGAWPTDDVMEQETK
jgi:hypothetical protein